MGSGDSGCMYPFGHQLFSPVRTDWRPRASPKATFATGPSHLTGWSRGRLRSARGAVALQPAPQRPDAYALAHGCVLAEQRVRKWNRSGNRPTRTSEFIILLHNLNIMTPPRGLRMRHQSACGSPKRTVGSRVSSGSSSTRKRIWPTAFSPRTRSSSIRRPAGCARTPRSN